MSRGRLRLIAGERLLDRLGRRVGSIEHCGVGFRRRPGDRVRHAGRHHHEGHRPGGRRRGKGQRGQPRRHGIGRGRERANGCGAHRAQRPAHCVGECRHCLPRVGRASIPVAGAGGGGSIQRERIEQGRRGGRRARRHGHRPVPQLAVLAGASQGPAAATRPTRNSVPARPSPHRRRCWRPNSRTRHRRSGGRISAGGPDRAYGEPSPCPRKHYGRN